MRILFIIVLLNLLAACQSTTKNNTVSAQQDEEGCGISAMLAGISCVDPDMSEIAKHPLGSAGNPVRADGPAGQRDYIRRLICKDGNNIEGYARMGSAGLGPYGFIVDSYTVACKTGENIKELVIYMDLYHPGYQEKYPAQGFSDMELK